LSNGSVEKCVLHLGAEVDDATLATAGALLDTQLSGSPWSSLSDVTPVAGPDADGLAKEARDALAARSGHEPVEPVYVGGASRLAVEQESFPTSTSAARLLELLERQAEVVSMVHDLLDTGPTVRIGSENPIDELRDCSIVVAPYRVDGQVAGTVGVLGPTRMDYRQALAAVEAISRQLGIVLS
jgi:heat-inducible transcriptional repressor